MAFGGFGGFSGFGAATRPVAQFPPLTPEEEESLLNRIMGTAMGGLQWVGQTLDKPGAAIRGLLAGEPDQLLNLIPFSDTLGITDPSERVYGRDLLEKAGMRKNKETGILGWLDDPGEGLRDLAGFLVELGTDPLSFVNPFGALTKGGQVAQRAGLLEDLPLLAKERALEAGAALPGKRAMRSGTTLSDLRDFAMRRAPDDVARQEIDDMLSGAAAKMGIDVQDLMQERLGGSIGFSMGPLGRSTALGGPTGEVGRFGTLMDTIGTGIAGSGPGRAFQAMFSRPVLGQTDALAQQELKFLDRNKQLISSESSRDLFRLRDELEANLTQSGLNPADDNVTDALRAYAENFDNYKNPAVMGDDIAKELPELPEGAKNLVKAIVERKDKLYGELVETGLVEPHFFDSRFGTGHFFRQATDHVKGGKIVSHSHKQGPRAFERDAMFARNPELDVPGGTVRIERLLSDPRLTRGEGRLGEVGRHRVVAEEVFGLPKAQFDQAAHHADMIEKGFITADELSNAHQVRLSRYQKAKDLSHYLSLQERRGTRRYGHHLLEDDRTYTVSVRGAKATADAIHDMFAQGAKTFDEIVAQGLNPDDFTLLENAYTQAGFKGKEQALQNFLTRTGRRFGANAEEIASGLYVPSKTVEAATDVLKQFESPREIGKFLDFFDRFGTNLFKLGATAHPAFHVRNNISATIQNVLSGAYNFATAGKYIKRGHQFSAGKTIEGLAKHEGIKKLFGTVSDEEATKKLAELVEIYNLRGSRFEEILEQVDEAGELVEGRNPWERLSLAYPSQKPLSIPQMYENFKEGLKAEPTKKGKLGALFNPARVPGIGKDVVQDTNVFSNLHKEAARYTEDVARVGAFLGYLDQGFSPAAAARRVKVTHVDYKNLSNFDRAFMRRAIPFWSFFKGMSSHVTEEIMSHPGGRLAQTIRGSNKGRDGDAHTPDYIGEGLAIKLGPDKYISRLGLMHEAPFESFAFRTKPGAEEGEPASVDVFNTAARTLQKIGSMANPVFKTPTELAFDKQLFTGRQFKDLYQYPFNDSMLRSDISQLSNLLINASPASRAVRTVRKLSDERKSLPEKLITNLTGLGITDVYGGAERAKELDAVRRREELLEASPNIKEFSTLYAPEALRGNLTPTERALLRLQTTQRARQKEAALAD